MRYLSPSIDDYNFVGGYLLNKISDRPPPLVGAQNNRNNIVSQSQNEQPEIDQGGDKSEDDNDSTKSMPVLESDVRLNCLQCSHQFIAINHALQGANYNTPIKRKVIYTIGQTSFTQLLNNNAKIVAELLDVVENVSFLIC